MARKDRRLELDAMFRELTPYVYFQPPASVTMKYPAIRYELSRLDMTPADNKSYLVDAAYQVTVIDPDPDSAIADQLLEFEYCRFNRSYTANNLNHFVFVIYH